MSPPSLAGLELASARQISKEKNSTFVEHPDITTETIANLHPSTSMFGALHISMLIAACLLFAISVTLLGLVCNSLAYGDSSIAKNSVIALSNGTVQNTFAYLPASVDTGSYWIIFAAGLGGTLDAPLVIFCILRRAPIRCKTCSFQAFYAAINSLSFLRISVGIAAMAYSFIGFSRSSSFDLNATPDERKRYPGRFTLEAFNCHLKDYVSSEENGRFNQWCSQGRAARWLLLPYILISVCLLLLSSIAIWKKKSKVVVLAQEIM